jgi:collagenase-like PrtC family protease
MLKITAPFTEEKEVIPLIEAGADELYCGYLSPEWEKKYTSLEFERKGGGSNFTDLKSLRQAVDLSHKRNVPVYLALNGLYVKEQYPLLLKTISQLNKIDLDGYIVADIGLLLTLLEHGCKKELHISTGGTVFNSEAVRFFKNLGATRIILDRQTSLGQIGALSSENSRIDFGVFIMNTFCVYIDGFCTFLHTYGVRPRGDIRQKNWQKNEVLNIQTTYDTKARCDACRLKYSIRAYGNTTEKRIDTDKISPHFYKQLIDGVECGACALYDINNTIVKTVKIVGRQLSAEARLRDTGFISSALGILRNNKKISREDFILNVQELYRKTYNYRKPCQGNNCYHPEVLWTT